MKEREYAVIEDHISIGAPTVNQNIDMWAIVRKNNIYVRTLNEAVTLDFDDNVISNEFSKENDLILKNESQFGRYLDEYEKVFMYNSLVLKQTTLMNSNARLNLRKNFPIIAFHYFMDYFKKFN